MHFSSPDPKGHLSYCYHYAYVVRCRHKPLKSLSFPLKPMGKFEPNLQRLVFSGSFSELYPMIPPANQDGRHLIKWKSLKTIINSLKIPGQLEPNMVECFSDSPLSELYPARQTGYLPSADIISRQNPM